MVIDSTDRDRLHISAQELHKMMDNDTLKTSILLVLANKQDMKNAMTASQISDALKLSTLRDRQWHIQVFPYLHSCCYNLGLNVILIMSLVMLCINWRRVSVNLGCAGRSCMLIT